MSVRSTNQVPESVETLVDVFLAEQRQLTAVEQFAQRHADTSAPLLEPHYRQLMPLSAPRPGEQYAFEVDLDRCSSCKACVSACHSMNGLDDDESWREVTLLLGGGFDRSRIGRGPVEAVALPVTSACHHCAEPGCLEGCPVLAYDKDPLTGIVRHLDDQCIGCSYCILKCPYDVPKYSAKRGIVRKCDLCHGRLAEGEAPACVQACPNEAIRVTKVRVEDVKARSAAGGVSSGGCALPGMADPAITQPTTVYRTTRPLEGMVALGPPAGRVAETHWPLVWMLVLTQAGGGMVGGQVLWDAPNLRVCVAGWLLFQAGLVASVFHLGQPMKAWRVWMGWRTSWLSREAMVLGAVAGVLGVATAAVWGLASGWMTGMAAWVRTVGSVGVLAAVGAATFAQVMVYVDTRRPAWAWRQTGPRFVSTVLGGAVAGITMDRWGVAGLVAGLVLLGVMVFERRAFFRGMRGRTERTGEASH